MIPQDRSWHYIISALEREIWTLFLFDFQLEVGRAVEISRLLIRRRSMQLLVSFYCTTTEIQTYGGVGEGEGAVKFTKLVLNIKKNVKKNVR